MGRFATALLVATLALFGANGGCSKKYDVPAGGDQGDSAGDSQPGAACSVGAGGQAEEPAAKVQFDKYVYDVYIELWDEDCNSSALADDGKMADGKLIKPVHVFIDGSINGEPAQYLGTFREGDVDTPFHVRGFVNPRNAPHQMSIVADVNRAARKWVDEVLGDGYLHCRIMRDSAPIVVVKGSRDRVSHTTALVDGQAQVNYHLFVGVG